MSTIGTRTGDQKGEIMRQQLRSALLLGLLALVTCGCSYSEPPAATVMTAAQHTHFHVHAADASHEHSHEGDAERGGHVHAHSHEHSTQ